MSHNANVIILGAGAAGLSAAMEISRAGGKVVILEARDRLGGRIFTCHDSVCDVPVELGAEFIHGRPPEIWDLLTKQNIRPRELTGENFCVRNGELRTCDFFSEVDSLLEKLDDRSPDESFLEFIQRCYPDGKADPKQRESVEWAMKYVTGFHAADPSLVSVHWLANGLHADEKIEGDRAFRIPQGYESVIDIFRQGLPSPSVSIELNTIVETIRWTGGQVEINARTVKGPLTFNGSRVLVTLPLSVLQAGLLEQNHKETGVVRFVPGLPPKKQEALGKLVMGKVIRVTLSFRERFWENLRPLHSTESKTLSEMCFLFADENPFPTWWTMMPEKLPIINGWAPFKCAEALSGKGQDFIIDKALDALGRLLKVDRHKLDALLGAAYTHDWETDPFARGAYSYVKVGGDAAQRELATPVEDALFFAGEAIDCSGHNGTVHGAIASGRSAAKGVMRSLR
jgi:monoamine oxidase